MSDGMDRKKIEKEIAKEIEKARGCTVWGKAEQELIKQNIITYCDYLISTETKELREEVEKLKKRNIEGD